MRREPERFLVASLALRQVTKSPLGGKQVTREIKGGTHMRQLKRIIVGHDLGVGGEVAVRSAVVLACWWQEGNFASEISKEILCGVVREAPGIFTGLQRSHHFEQELSHLNDVKIRKRSSLLLTVGSTSLGEICQPKI